MQNTMKNKTNPTKALLKSLAGVVNEKDVENAYRSAFTAHFGAEIASPHSVDGYLVKDPIRCIMEFKDDLNLKIKSDLCSVLIQVVYYLKRFVVSGEPAPNAIFIGDRNECLVLPVAQFETYLKMAADWSSAPSSAHKTNPGMLAAMIADAGIVPFVHDVPAPGFDVLLVFNQIEALAAGSVLKVKITQANVTEIFNSWRTQVLSKKHTLTLTQQSDVFLACLTDRASTFLHPKKKNLLTARGVEIPVNSDLHRAFFSHFEQDLSPSELEVLVAAKDRIVDDIQRRMTGAFFTPAIWVAEAHKMIAEIFGSSWKEKFVVWDCASGTGNLTKDYHFKELYASTLDAGDVAVVRDLGYDRAGTVFQYDFLNDDVTEESCTEFGVKVPAGLQQAFREKKPVLFFINPPYGTNGFFGATGTSKAGIAQTRLNKLMLRQGGGKASQQLYAQFMWRIAELKKINPNVHVAIYSTPLFISGASFKSFRPVWYDSFAFKTGMLFQASHFADTAGTWGVCFTLWAPGTTQQTDLALSVALLDSEQTFTITMETKKVFYPAPDGIQIAKWVRDSTDQIRKEAPALSSALRTSGLSNRMTQTAIGVLLAAGNSVYENDTKVGLFSSDFSHVNSTCHAVTPKNLHQVAALFLARKSVHSDWINDKDEYLVPNEAHLDYTQWNNDALIYLLFNNSSQQSAMRDFACGGRQWDLKNEFFWLSLNEIRELADEAHFRELYEDTTHFAGDRHLHGVLKDLVKAGGVSPLALTVLRQAGTLLRKSMKLRAAMHEEHPEYHLHAWDAGYAQLKFVWKKHFAEEFAAFRDTYKQLEAQLRPGVWKFGFLR